MKLISVSLFVLMKIEIEFSHSNRVELKAAALTAHINNGKHGNCNTIYMTVKTAKEQCLTLWLQLSAIHL